MIEGSTRSQSNSKVQRLHKKLLLLSRRLHFQHPQYEKWSRAKNDPMRHEVIIDHDI